jgi:hypothetical protein
MVRVGLKEIIISAIYRSVEADSVLSADPVAPSSASSAFYPDTG